MDTKLEKQLDECLNDAKRVMQKCLEDGDELPPALFICVNGNMGIIDVGFMMNGPGKDALSNMLRSHIVKPEVDMFILVTEAWMATMKLGESKPSGSLEDMPGRTEALMCIVMTKEEDLAVAYPIDKEKKTIGEAQRMPSAKGRFARKDMPGNMDAVIPPGTTIQ